MREGRNKGMMLVPLGPWREKETTGPAEVPAVPEVNPFVAESERGCGERVWSGNRAAGGGHGQATVVPQPVEMHLSILTMGIVVMPNAS